ncbi:MAG TPA: F0F1 ATP synthase subunit alpha, partial [Azospirillum sp.]
ERLVAEGRARLAEERRQAVGELRTRAAALGTDVAARLLRVSVGEGMAEGFLEAACRSVEALSEPRRRALAGDGDPVAVRLVTSAPLMVPEGERWQERLAAALGRPVAVEFAEDAGLIAGVELHFPHTVLRHSWKQALAEAMEELTRDDDNTHHDAHHDAGRRA